jgi:hypothetical protein
VGSAPWREPLNAVVCSRVQELQEALSAATSRSRSAAAIPRSRRSKSAGIACAPASTLSWIKRSADMASVPPVPFGRARDQPDGCGPHPPRGERPGVEPGCASTCRPTFPIKLERTSRGGTEARLADTSSRHTRSRTAARRCRATRCRRRCADRASRGARLFHPHPSSEPK